MPRLDTLSATVIAIDRADTEILHARARADGEEQERRIIAYPTLTGPLAVGDRVQLNVTATALSLGTGGVDFVMSTVDSPSFSEGRAFGRGGEGRGEHILKLRYTPHQHAVSAVEMSDAWVEGQDLAGVPVVACGLHSQVALVAAGAKATRPDCRIAYVMTDSAALPLAFSHLVRQLQAVGLLESTLTCGQAFGGELECVTLPSALLAAKHVAHADLVIVAPGPGNAGTGTRYGFSGIEQAWALDLAAALGGLALCCLRASSADPRPRHQGLSHHSRTVLSLCARRPLAAWPKGFGDPPTDLPATLRLCDGGPGLELLAEHGLRTTSMGRTAEQDPLFFHTAAACGRLGADAIHSR